MKKKPAKKPIISKDEVKNIQKEIEKFGQKFGIKAFKYGSLTIKVPQKNDPPNYRKCDCCSTCKFYSVVARLDIPFCKKFKKELDVFWNICDAYKASEK